MLRDLLKLTLLGPTGIQTAGIAIQVHGQFVHIVAKLHVLLSDGDGLRQALQWMGSGSMKPCFRHWNVLMKDSGRVEHARTTEYVEISCHDTSKFRPWAQSELNVAIDVCVEAQAQHNSGTMSKDRLEKTCRNLGFKASRAGLLADPELRCAVDWMAVVRYDWAHTLLSDGIVAIEMWALIDFGEESKQFSQADVYAFMSEPWDFPAHGRTRTRCMRKLFDEHARKLNSEHAPSSAP